MGIAAVVTAVVLLILVAGVVAYGMRHMFRDKREIEADLVSRGWYRLVPSWPRLSPPKDDEHKLE